MNMFVNKYICMIDLEFQFEIEVSFESIRRSCSNQRDGRHGGPQGRREQGGLRMVVHENDAWEWCTRMMHEIENDAWEWCTRMVVHKNDAGEWCMRLRMMHENNAWEWWYMKQNNTWGFQQLLLFIIPAWWTAWWATGAAWTRGAVIELQCHL